MALQKLYMWLIKMILVKDFLIWVKVLWFLLILYATIFKCFAEVNHSSSIRLLCQFLYKNVSNCHFRSRVIPNGIYLFELNNKNNRRMSLTSF